MNNVRTASHTLRNWMGSDVISEITKIETRYLSGGRAVLASLSTPLMRDTKYLLITTFKGPYWFFHGFDQLLFNRTIDDYDGWTINQRRRHSDQVEREWFRQKDCWVAMFDWLRQESIRYGTFHVLPSKLVFSWYGSSYTDTDVKNVIARMHLLVQCVGQLE